MGTRRYYAPEFRTEAVGLVQGDYTVQVVAEQLGIPKGTLWNWVHGRTDNRVAAAATGAAGTEVVDRAVHQAALRRIAELERENEFLGKASAYFAQKVHP